MDQLVAKNYFVAGRRHNQFHNDPLRALSTVRNPLRGFKELMMRLKTVALAVGREI